MKKILPLLLLWPFLAYGQVKLPNFPASPGVAGTDLTWDDTGTTTQKATFNQVATFIINSIPSLLSCSANQVIFDNGSGNLACDASFSYTLSTQALLVGTLSTSGFAPSYLLSQGVSSLTNSHAYGIWADGAGEHFSTVPDSLTPSSTDDFMTIQRNNGSVGCQTGGVIVDPSLPCRVLIGTNSATYLGSSASHGEQIIIGPMNAPGQAGNNDFGYRLRCFDNDSCVFIHGNHVGGTQAYEWSYFYAGPQSSARYGWMSERVPTAASSASTAQRQPHLTGAFTGTVSGSITTTAGITTLTTTAGTPTVGQTLVFSGSAPSSYLVQANPSSGQYTLSQSCVTSCSSITGNAYNSLPVGYEGWMTSVGGTGGFVWQMSDGGNDSDNGGPLNGTTWFKGNKVAGTSQINTQWGENTNSSSVTNLVGGSPANTQVNGNPAVGANGSWTAGDCAALASATNNTVGDTGGPCLLLVSTASISNVATLSGSQSITTPNGQSATVLAGSSILLTGQTTASQNGPWFIPSGGGAWVRLGVTFQTGNVIPQFASIMTREAATDSLYILQTGAAVTVDTSSQTWVLPTTVYTNSTTQGDFGPAPNISGNGISSIFQGGDSVRTSGNSNGGQGTFRGGNGSILTSGTAAGGPAVLQGGKGGSTAGSGIGGNASCIGGPGSTTTTGNSTGGDCILKAGAVGSGTGSNGSVRIQDQTNANWSITNSTIGFNFPPKTSNGGITCNSGAAGSFMTVSDASSPVIGGTYSNGGSTNAVIQCNGSSWIVAITAGALPTVLSGTTGSIGGSALLAGQCAAGTATVTGATTSMVAVTSPSSDPDSTLSTGIAIYPFVSAANTVTVRVCAIVAVTPAAATYNVRVLQ